MGSIFVSRWELFICCCGRPFFSVRAPVISTASVIAGIFYITLSCFCRLGTYIPLLILSLRHLHSTAIFVVSALHSSAIFVVSALTFHCYFYCLCTYIPLLFLALRRLHSTAISVVKELTFHCYFCRLGTYIPLLILSLRHLYSTANSVA